ncbi:MAG: DUF7282 domain-containing protein [Coriobacteriia bacterium]
MKVSNNAKRLAVAAIFIAEVVVMVAIAYGAADLPSGSIMVGDDDVVIEVEDQQVYGAFAISRVVTPVDGWVIVRADRGDGTPAELIGAAPVTAGENTNVAVATGGAGGLPAAAFVSVVSDRGTRGEFEYTTGSPDDTFSLGGDTGGGMMGGPTEKAPVMTDPMDWPLVAGDEAVTERFAITRFNVAYRLTEANFATAYLDASGKAAQVEGLVAPDDSWIVIIRVSQGTADENEVIGSARVPAGRTDLLSVPVSEVTDGSEISALLVADLGASGVLEIDAGDPSRSVDSPYIVRSWFVWKRVAPAH